MAFLSCEEMLAAARSQKITLAEAVLRSVRERHRSLQHRRKDAVMRSVFEPGHHV